jgi:predicted transcriptional regulator
LGALRSVQCGQRSSRLQKICASRRLRTVQDEPKTPLQRLREKRGLTLKEVADAVDTDTGNLSRMERGHQKSVELAERLVKFYGQGQITELEILYPERYPAPATQTRSRRRRAAGAAAR